MNRITIKRIVKQTAGRASVLLEPFVRRSGAPTVCILCYHRVARITATDPNLDSWNVPPDVFNRQMAAISEIAECVRLDDLPGRLATGAPSPERPMACLTFDDGFLSTFTEVLPILRRYGLPATVFVVTKYVGTHAPMPFDRWGRRHARHEPREAWRPLDWSDIKACVDSGLVSIGGHSHRHVDGRLSAASELYDEARNCRRVLEDRLGNAQARAYAYPYGCTRLGEVPVAYRDAVRSAGFALAVSTDLGLATAESDLFRLPRIEVTAVDTPEVLRAKVHGSLLPLRITDCLRQARRSA